MDRIKTVRSLKISRSGQTLLRVVLLSLWILAKLTLIVALHDKSALEFLYAGF